MKAKIIAANDFGSSTESSANVVGALIQTVPHIPTIAPTSGTSTGETQIELTITALTGVATGGSPITSYVILWD